MERLRDTLFHSDAEFQHGWWGGRKVEGLRGERSDYYVLMITLTPMAGAHAIAPVIDFVVKVVASVPDILEVESIESRRVASSRGLMLGASPWIWRPLNLSLTKASYDWRAITPSAIRVLREAGLRTIGELVQLRESDLLQLDPSRLKAPGVRRIKLWLHDLGLDLGVQFHELVRVAIKKHADDLPPSLPRRRWKGEPRAARKRR